MSCLFIRADAAPEIGTGHVMRMLALAQGWQDRGDVANGRKPEVCFICAELPELMERRLCDEGCTVVRITAVPGSQDDLEQTLQAVNSTLQALQVKNSFACPSSNWIVIDGYAFDVDYQQGIRAAGYKLMVVDDYNHLAEYDCDVLLNQNIGADQYDYIINEESKRLLGTQYVLLRREFRNTAFRGEYSDVDDLTVVRGADSLAHHSNVLVTMGGADLHNVTLKVVEALNKLEGKLNVKVLLGPANLHKDRLSQAVVSSSTVHYELLSVTEDMPTLIQWADVAISAGGSTCWEFCLFNVPMILCVLAENQRRIVEQLVALGAARYGAEWTQINTDTLSSEIDYILNNGHERSSVGSKAGLLVDEYGVSRILEMICPTSAEKMILRPARLDDVSVYYKWANDPLVRENCFNRHHFEYRDHVRWFKQRMSSKEMLMIVAELGGLPVGQVRYEKSGEEAVVGISIDSAFRGKGLGQRIIEQSVDIAFEKLRVKQIRAEVFLSNKPSQLLFERTGFELSCSQDIMQIPCRVYYYRT